MRLINDMPHFTKSEVAEMVMRSPLTIHYYDVWSREREERGEERYIPKPKMIGKYRYWSMEDIKAIGRFIEWLEEHRGALARYNRRLWKKKDEEVQNLNLI